MPLEWAVVNNLSEVVVDLLKQGASMYKNNNEVIAINAKDFSTYLDESVTVDKPEEKWRQKSDEKLVFDYSFFSKEGEDQTPVLNSVLKLSSEHKELVKHPMVRAFLMMKWKKMVPMWTLWTILKLIFFMHLVGFAVVLQTSNEQNATSNKTCNVLTNPLGLFDSDLNLNLDTEKIVLMTTQMTFSLLLLFFSLIEAVQMLTSVKAWSSERKNWLQTAIIGGSTYLCYAMFSGSGHCETRHVVATLLPMVYYEGLYEVGYHYKLAKYINLFNRVLKTFFKYFVAYAGLIICFAGGYAVMLPAPEDPEEYPDTFWGLLPKVFVMVTGEEDYMNIPFSKSVVFRVWEVLFFLVFLTFTVVILLNLLNGLAVADARDMLEASETDSLCSLLETAAFWDKRIWKEKPSKQKIKTKKGQSNEAEKKIEEENMKEEAKEGEKGQMAGKLAEKEGKYELAEKEEMAEEEKKYEITEKEEKSDNQLS